MSKVRTGDVNLALSEKTARLIEAAIDAFREKHLRVLNEIAFRKHSGLPIPPALYEKRAALDDALAIRTEVRQKLVRYHGARARRPAAARA